jgi:signal transduction histidine kinase
VQILVNLMDNAAKYSPDGSSIEVSWAEEEARAMVRVRDHGSGLPADGRERLFTRFGRVPGSRIRAGRVGTGLGLYLGRSFAQAMHGDLTLERTGPEGSVFCLELPLAMPRS